MVDPAWDEGCKSCSLVPDNFAGALVHLAARDTSFAVISRAPIARIECFKKRMGWSFSGCPRSAPISLRFRWVAPAIPTAPIAFPAVGRLANGRFPAD
jgi:Bacterial protein of unknown function (DUF899)